MGNVISVKTPNPILDNIVYNVMYPYVYLQKYKSNIISEKMYSQVDAARYQYQLMDEILDHITNGHDVCGDDDFVTSRSGHKT